MRRFTRLRTTPWEPTFDWLRSPRASAIRINQWHEDHPRRVEVTSHIIGSFSASPKWDSPQKTNGQSTQHPGPMPIPNAMLQKLHRNVFDDQGHAGSWRRLQNRVELHGPPPAQDVQRFMQELEDLTMIRSVDDLRDWYWDFCTIHPFLDGNGRVGGIVVATYSHILHPVAGWLSPNQ
jgi:hypothetical protein